MAKFLLPFLFILSGNAAAETPFPWGWADAQINIRDGVIHARVADSKALEPKYAGETCTQLISTLRVYLAATRSYDMDAIRNHPVYATLYYKDTSKYSYLRERIEIDCYADEPDEPAFSRVRTIKQD